MRRYRLRTIMGLVLIVVLSLSAGMRIERARQAAPKASTAVMLTRLTYVVRRPVGITACFPMVSPVGGPEGQLPPEVAAEFSALLPKGDGQP